MPTKLRDRVCASCATPIWYNTFLTEWFHDDESVTCALAEPAPIKAKRKRARRVT